MKSLSKIFVLLIVLGITQCQTSSHPSKWSDQQLNEWIESGQYLNGLQLLPGPSTDNRAFAEHYYNHKEVWDKAFAFLKDANLDTLPLGRIELGDNMYATVSEYYPKDREVTLFEAHEINIDIHYVIYGKELIDVAPLESMTVTRPYDEKNDILFGTVPKFTELKASPDRFFVIFPYDAHRPSVTDGNDSIFTRKIVVKFPMKIENVTN